MWTNIIVHTAPLTAIYGDSGFSGTCTADRLEESVCFTQAFNTWNVPACTSILLHVQ